MHYALAPTGNLKTDMPLLKMDTPYILAVVGSNLDIVLLCSGYCRRCADNKLNGVLSTYPITKEECQSLNKPGASSGRTPWKIYKVSCQCVSGQQ